MFKNYNYLIWIMKCNYITDWSAEKELNAHIHVYDSKCGLILNKLPSSSTWKFRRDGQQIKHQVVQKLSDMN